MVEAMQATMRYLCENIQGCVLGYTQSDEITLVLADYKKLTSAAWFDYNIQKCVSVAASMATLAFNKAFARAFENWGFDHLPDWEEGGTNEVVDDTLLKLCETYNAALEKGALFDARVFSLPKEEVCNCVLWRQQDATRNSIEAVAQAHFSAKELHCKNQKQMLEMLRVKHSINWSEDFPLYLQRGSCCIKEKYFIKGQTGEPVQRSRWIVDQKIPLFTGDGRDYIESRIKFEDGD